MTAVDLPPGGALAARPAGEFGAHPRARRIARRAGLCTLAAAAGTVYVAGESLARPGASGLVILAGVCVTLAAVLVAVRSARIRVDERGVAWTALGLSVRLGRERLARAEAYRDGVALVPESGSVWFLSAKDWDRLEALPALLSRYGVAVAPRGGPAPLRARAQGYGTAADLLLVLLATAATVTLAASLAL